MIHNLAKRIDKIEQKVGGDTTKIRTFADLIFFASIQDKTEMGIKIGKVTYSPEIEEFVSKIVNLAEKIREKQGKTAGQNETEGNNEPKYDNADGQTA